MYQPGISRLAARSIYNKAKQMAIIESKVHAFWVRPKDCGDEYQHLGFIIGSIPDMNSEFIFYNKTKDSTAICAIKKDTIDGFELIALDEENPNK